LQRLDDITAMWRVMSDILSATHLRVSSRLDSG
jgi:hypothetical protein